MNKAWIIVAVGAVIGGAFMFNAEARTPEIITSSAPEQIDLDAYYEPRMIGTSMQQFGFNDGEVFKVYHNRDCKPGDFCSFTCLVDKCLGNYGKSKGIGDWVKRLISINEDCYWFEGNPEPWLHEGIEVQSVDSRIYGCLKPSEFVMNGVAVPNSK